MSSAINFALQEIRARIRPQLLTEAFQPQLRMHSIVPTDLSTLIRKNVIDSRVMTSCNLIGGEEILLDLSGLPRDVPDERSSLYYIPMELTQGRQIMAVNSVSYGYGQSIAYSSYNPWFDSMQQQGCGNAGILTAANPLYAAMANMPIVETARVSLVNVNVIMIQDQIRIPDRVFLRCRIAHDSEMANIQSASWGAFAALCVLATQAYIYNNLIIAVNQGQILGGYEIGEFKNQLDNLADADELFLTYLNEKWYKTSKMNSAETHLRHVRNLMGGPW
jgi:hypothetical protein